MKFASNATRNRLGPFGSVLALAAALSGAQAAVAEEVPAEGSKTAVTEEPNTTTTSRPAVTLEQIQSAIVEAAQQRDEAMAPDPSVPKSITEKWGVEVIRIDYTADGYWLGFRFRVTDVDKALPLFDSRIKPYVESEETGVKLAVPTAAKVGALRTTNRGKNIKPDKIYAIMFSNPGAQVKPGQKVSVVIGDFKVEHLTVN